MPKWKNNKPKRSFRHNNKRFPGKGDRRPHNAPNSARQGDYTREKRMNGLFSSLQEKDVGVTEYVREAPGFTGLIKARFSDFHVNEIDVDGNEVKLTNLEAPVAKEDSLGEEELGKSKNQLEDIITEDTWQNIRELLKDRSADPKKSVDIDVTELDKDKRTLIHKTLKAEFGPAIVSTTSTVEEKKLIQCFRAKGHMEVKRHKWLWPGDYVYFVVHKENIDTVRAASDLARNLSLRASSINYAGTKDKRAKTSQLFCVKKREPGCIAKSVQGLSYLKVGNFTFNEKVLKLGNLKGNRFRIAIRQVDGDETEIEASLKSTKDDGFVNYYGLQRFGNCAGVPTYDVGIALLKSDYKEACELILKPRQGEPNFMKEAREYWWKTRDAVKAAAMLYSSKYIEKKLLDGLAEFGDKDFANALRKIPRNMLLLYTHSYQSLVWNRVASRRLKELGFKPIVGDLVLKEKTNGNEPDLLEVVDDVALDEIDDADSGAEDADEKNESDSTLSEYKTMVTALTEDDILSKKYTIFDVVLPLPGHDITYPSNEVSKWYDDILAEKGLTSEKLKHNVKTYSLAGAYRKLVVKPENMTWQFKRYDSPTCTLIASDVETLHGVAAEADNPDGKSRALLLDFVLPSSAYATMALRELLKADTSVESQQKLAEQLELKSRMTAPPDKECEIELLSLSAKENVEKFDEDGSSPDETSDPKHASNNEIERKRKNEDVSDDETKKAKVE